MKTLLRNIWRRWTRAAHWLGETQAVVIYTVLYFALLGPIALVRQLFADPLNYRKRRHASFWLPRKQRPTTIEEARSQ